MSELKIEVTHIRQQILTFKLSIAFSQDHKLVCYDADQARGSLLKGIFENDNVQEVCLGAKELRVRLKQASDQWNVEAKRIGQVIRTNFNQVDWLPQDFIARSKAYEQQDQLDENSQLLKKVDRIIDEQIRPVLAGHGGNVDVVEIKDQVVYLNFSGGCQGCSQVSVTVKNGIERLLLDRLPEIKAVKDITEHSLGDNPYYD